VLPQGGAAGTLKGLGNFGSHSVIDAGKALGAGQKWLGAGYKEIAPGVFRSADGLRQFRMTNADILGAHGNIGSHVHFEALNDSVMHLRATVRTVTGETTHLQGVRRAGELEMTPVASRRPGPMRCGYVA